MSDYLRNPFPGLRSFELEDADIFFGRDTQIDEIVTNLLSNKFLAVLGPSGAGKSSIVKAGVIPKLLKDKTSKWNYTVLTLNNTPLASFSAAIAKFLNNYSTEKIELEMANNKYFVNEIVKQLQQNTEDKYLIYIQQFEDIFIFKNKNDKYTLNARMFVEYMLNIVNQSENIFIIVSLITDYIDFCREFDGLTDVINRGHYLLPKLTLEQKKQAIFLPFQKNNIKISSELIVKIIEDISNEEAELSVLQHTLKRIWDYCANNSKTEQTIDIIHYESVGKIENCLSNHAEEIYHNLDSEKYQTIAEKIFKSLIIVKSDNTVKINSLSLQELCDILNVKNEDVIKVLDEFRNTDTAFILPYNDNPLDVETIISINKEIIIQKWFRLNDWILTEKTSVQTYLQISRAAQLYYLGESSLLTNPELQNGIDWYKNQQPNQAWANRYDAYFERNINYLQYSQKEYDFQIQLKEKKQKRDIHRFRFFAIILGLASLISILFLIFALNLKFKAEASEKQAKLNESVALENSNIAEDKKKEAVSSKKVAEQQQLLAEQQKIIAEQQRLLAIEKQREAILQKQIAEESKLDAEISRDKAKELQKEAEKLRDNALEQKRIAEEQEQRAKISEAKTDTLRRLAIAKSLAANSYKILQQNEKSKEILAQEQILLPKIMAIHAYNFNKENGGIENDPEIFNALSEVSGNVKIIQSSLNHADAVRDVVYIENNKFVTCGNDGAVKIWNLQDTTLKSFVPLNLKRDNNMRGGARSLCLSGDKKKLAAGAYNGKILLWNEITEQNKPIILDAHTSVVNNLFFINENKNILSISNDKKLILWDLTTMLISFKILKIFEIKPVFTCLSKDTKILAVADAEGYIYFYDTKDFLLTKVLAPINKSITAVEFIDNHRVAVASNTGTIEIWNIDIDNTLVSTIYAHLSTIADMKYNASLSQLATCSYDGDVKIWNTNNFEDSPLLIDKCVNWVHAIVYSPDNEHLLVGSADKTKQILFFNININTIYTGLRQNIEQNMSENDWLKYVGPGIEYLPKLK